MNYRWNWSVLFQEPYLGWLLSGLRWTILVTVCACSIGLLLGTIIGVARTLPSRAARALGGAYVELFRNVPVLVQLFLWFYVLPELVPDNWGRWLKRDLPLPEFWTGLISAVHAESSLGSVPSVSSTGEWNGQRHADSTALPEYCRASEASPNSERFGFRFPCRAWSRCRIRLCIVFRRLRTRSRSNCRWGRCASARRLTRR